MTTRIQSPSWLLGRLLSLLLLLALPVMVQAQFNYATNSGTITITGYYGQSHAVTIPSTINGLPVTSIGDHAISYSAVTSVLIPSSVISIGPYAFFDSTGLGTLTLGSGVIRIGNQAFAFTGLTSVTIPNNATSIGEGAFGGCYSLTSVTIVYSLSSIGDVAFSGCTSLTGVYFKGNAPSLGGASVFDGDDKATVYYLPGITGWGPTFGGRPTALWFLPNPLILTSSPSFGIQTNGFGFIISWATNIPVVVEASVNVANPDWSPISTNTLTGGWSYFSDPNWSNYPSRFYRLRSP
jgi:BspA type Leucine rich repeat region (6 copies)